MTTAVMRPLLEAHERRESQIIYMATAVWMLTDRLNAIVGADKGMPRYCDAYPSRRQCVSARAIRLDLQQGLRAERERRKQDA